MKRDTRKHRFLVGYPGDGECAYGFDGTGGDWLNLMTREEAASAARERLVDVTNTRVVYELVPVLVIKREKRNG